MILVTGATGFIGSHLVYHLLRSGQQLACFRRQSSSLKLLRKLFSWYGNDNIQALDKVRWIDGDLLDYYSVRDALEGVTHIYHTGAMVSFHSEDREELIRTNITGTANLVNAALEADVKKLCYTSTIGALGRAVSKGVVTEETHFVQSRKNSVYSISKYEAEREVWRAIAEGLNAIIVNPSVVVGPGNWNRGSSQVFQTMAGGLKFYPIGTTGFIDVNDVVKAMVLLMEGPYNNERFILNTENVSYRQFFQWMADEMGLPPPRFKAGPLLTGIGWRGIQIMGMISGRRSTITRETARTANQTYRYSNRKLLEKTNIELLPVEESVRRTARIYLKDQGI